MIRTTLLLALYALLAQTGMTLPLPSCIIVYRKFISTACSLLIPYFISKQTSNMIYFFIQQHQDQCEVQNSNKSMYLRICTSIWSGEVSTVLNFQVFSFQICIHLAYSYSLTMHTNTFSFFIVSITLNCYSRYRMFSMQCTRANISVVDTDSQEHWNVFF